MMGVHMHRLHSVVLQELPQGEPVVARRLHARDHSGLAMLFCNILHPCLECLEASFCVAEFQRFLCVLVVAPVKCPGIMGLASHIDPYD